jgi:hypothetical protein
LLTENKRRAFDLFLISFLAMFFETLCIRWIGSEIRVFAYFKNAVLMACFLGMGIGVFITDKKKNYFHWFIPMMALLVIGIYLTPANFKPMPLAIKGSISIWGFREAGNAASASVLKALWNSKQFFGTMIGILAFIVLMFVQLGKQIGVCMSRFNPLKAYAINILGGVFGVIVFTGMCFLQAGPALWFAFGLACTLYFFIDRKAVFAVGLICSVAICGVMYNKAQMPETHKGLPYIKYWSPYQKITITPARYKMRGGAIKQNGWFMYVNQDYLLPGIDLSPKALESFPRLKGHEQYYGDTYRLLKPKSVLIVGSGMGNDVAAALRSGVERVDAVEIDPLIIKLGKKLHPEKPYSSPKVHIYIDDARSFFNRTNHRYDLIQFGFLDSHLASSSHSTLRLDNFVYTVESFKLAQKLLKPEGHVCVQFIFRNPWLRSRFYNMLTEAFGYPPEFIQKSRLIIGNKPPINPPKDFLTKKEQVNKVLATDDWPFVYTKTKGIPMVYWCIMGLTLFISLLFLGAAVPKSYKRINVHFFFLGAAFMLIEVRSITQLSLLFGSTWVVTSMVILAVLLLIYAANGVVNRVKKIPLIVPYALVWGLLIFIYLYPAENLLNFSIPVRAVLATFMLTSPLFFAGIIFSTSFSKVTDMPTAFASNMIGAILGGLCEYASSAYGLRSLCLFSLGFYVISFLPLLSAKKRGLLFGK